MSWITQFEAAIRSLRDVESVSIVAEGDEIRELHIVSASSRPPKQIVRDVQTLLQSRFHRSLDYRVVSVAFVSGAEGGDAENGAAVAKPPGNGTVPHGRSRPAPVVQNGATHAPARPAAVTAPSVTHEEGRVRFSSVNLLVMGTRAQAQVELRWKGVSRIGNASGSSTRDGAHFLVAQATLAAIQQYLEDVPLEVDDVQCIHVGRKDVVVTALTMVAHRQEKTLVGSCTVEQDVQQAVVLATLSALNRVVGGLKARESVEYVLRPTSFRGA